jgi:histidyl-tRNA synthetase
VTLPLCCSATFDPLEDILASIQRAKGMLDVLPEDRRYWDVVIETATNLARRYGFLDIDVPVVEYTNLFARGMGEASDVFVQKEMYTIEEPDGTSITMRPEFTAGLVRAYIENGMASWPQPVKLFTTGPIFRRERPQAGRYRQHSQFDVEILGEMDPAADLEVMMLAMNLYAELGYKGLTFQLNSTGCPTCKPVYIEALTAYLADHVDKLAAIDKERLQKNPLRVLDSKEPGMDDLLEKAPHIIDYLCEDCGSHLKDLRKLLDALDQGYTINFRLVRGIDYYTKTVFEVWAEGIGAQAAVCGGGRYDGLAEAIGGPSTPGVGFGSGIERIILGLKEQGIEPPESQQPKVLVAHFGGVTKEKAVSLTYQLRDQGIATRLAFARDKRSMKSQMREANRMGAHTVLIIGESEVDENLVAVRPLDGGEQVRMPVTDVIQYLKNKD